MCNAFRAELRRSVCHTAPWGGAHRPIGWLKSSPSLPLRGPLGRGGAPEWMVNQALLSQYWLRAAVRSRDATATAPPRRSLCQEMIQVQCSASRATRRGRYGSCGARTRDLTTECPADGQTDRRRARWVAPQKFSVTVAYVRAIAYFGRVVPHI